MKPVTDSDGDVVKAGDFVLFSFGTPPVSVRSEIIERDGRLIALTPAHKPKECPAHLLMKHVCDFWIEKQR